MPTSTLPDYEVTSTFTNVVSTIAGLANTPALIQNLGQTNVAVVSQAAGAAPGDRTGVVLRPGEVIAVTAAQVWVKSFGPNGRVGVNLT